MKYLICIFVLVFSFKNNQAQKAFSNDTILSDFKYFVNLLENSHPDPYTAFGGRVFFYKRVFDLEKTFSKRSFSSTEFADTINAFLSPLCDIHTNIRVQNQVKSDNRWIPLQLGLATDGLFINNLLAGQKSMIGSKLLAIENIPIEKIIDKTSRIYSGENIFGYQGIIKNKIWDINFLNRIIPGIKNQVTFQIQTVDGKQKDLTISIQPDSSKLKITTSPKWNGISEDKYMFYQYVDKEKKIMYFNLSSIMDREAFKVMNEYLAPEITKTQLQGFYNSRMTIAQPENIKDAIEAIPSLSEMFVEMLQLMKENNSTTLIINLKNNSGGWLPTTFPTLYFLYGDNYLNADFNVTRYRRLSELYMQKNSTTIKEFNASNNTNYKLGDYSFEEDANNANQYNERLNELKNYCDSTLVNSLNGKAIYSPTQIYVITNDATASAATSYSYYLWKLGAKLVGVPSCQALNTYIEYTPYELPLTKLKGSISNCMDMCFPITDKRGKIFYPDYMLNIQDYNKYNFDTYSEVLYILDLIKRN